jgi:phosphoglycolate phosphatase
VRVCAFDLDHTLVRSPLDLAAMALDMRACVEGHCGPLPVRAERYRVGELITHCQTAAPELEAALWAIALDHEWRAIRDAVLEPGAREALAGARAAGFATALWTNNARAVTLAALERCGVRDAFDLVVTRDEMQALKPDPDGWRVIATHFGLDGEPDAGLGFMVGDSWVDGVAAAAAGVSFVAYRTSAEELARWRVRPVAHLTDLAALPAWLVTEASAGIRRAPG